MSVNIIYKQAAISEITDAMLWAVMEEVLRQWETNIYNGCSLDKLRQTFEAARKSEIERIEIVCDDHPGCLIAEYFIEGKEIIHDAYRRGALTKEENNTLGEALIKLGKQINNIKE